MPTDEDLSHWIKFKQNLLEPQFIGCNETQMCTRLKKKKYFLLKKNNNQTFFTLMGDNEEVLIMDLVAL